jgi:hypothetical protein
MYHKSGVKNIPHGAAGHFSRQNWGTITEQRDAAKVIVSRSHKLVKMTKLLSEGQWNKIIEAAKFYVSPAKGSTKDEDLFYEHADIEEEQEWVE